MNSSEFSYERINEEHYSFLEKILTNPSISKNFSKEKNYEKMEIIQILHQMIDFWKKYNFGIYVVSMNNQPIGIAGFKYIQKYNSIEILYALDEPYWGRGLATKIAKEITDHGLTKLNLKELYGIALLSNTKSINVLQKLGFEISEESTINSKTYVVLRLKNNTNEDQTHQYSNVVEIDL